MKKKIVYLFLLFILSNANTFAQGCAMCGKVAADDAKNGGTIAKGLNTGILFLMAFPYLILMTGAYFFFKKPIDAKLRGWKLKYFVK
ncbi:MAG TPA: hypothetical protein VFF27_17550 [Bacteroidia bacterium]|jgi:hypothetical protein|nr:hypothetical protein [Bacteroidia bacterium]